MVVGRIARRLNDEDILATHILHDLYENFLVGEAVHRAARKRNFKIGGDFLGQGAIGISGYQFHEARVSVLFVRQSGDAGCIFQLRSTRRVLAMHARRCKPGQRQGL